MPVGLPVSIGTVTAFNGAGPSSMAITTTVTVPANNAIFAMGTVGASLGASMTGVTDSAGNAYTIHVQTIDSNGMLTFLASCYNCLQLNAGSAITVTCSSVFNFAALQAAYDTGLLATGIINQSASNTGGSAGTGMIVGPTASTQSPYELVIAVFGPFWNASPSNFFTSGPGYTTINAITAPSTGGTCIMNCVEYQKVSAQGPWQAFGSVSQFTSYSAVIGTFFGTSPVTVVGDHPSSAAITVPRTRDLGSSLSTTNPHVTRDVASSLSATYVPPNPPTPPFAGSIRCAPLYRGKIRIARRG